jgi:hypothetical protein
MHICFLVEVIDNIAMQYYSHMSDNVSASIKHQLQSFISLVVYSMRVRRVLNTSAIRPKTPAKIRHIGKTEELSVY